MSISNAPCVGVFVVGRSKGVGSGANRATISPSDSLVWLRRTLFEWTALTVGEEDIIRGGAERGGPELRSNTCSKGHWDETGGVQSGKKWVGKRFQV